MNLIVLSPSSRRLALVATSRGGPARGGPGRGPTAEPKFFADDPLAREPETQDASGAQEWDIDLFYDLSYNLFVTSRRPVEHPRAET